MEQEKMLLNVHDVQAILGVSENLAYKVIRECNSELAKMNKIVIRGRVNRNYLMEKLRIEGV